MPGSDSPRFIGNSVASCGPECKFENMVQIENKCMSVDMFTNYKPSVFTCLDVYGQEQTLALQDLKEKFKKKVEAQTNSAIRNSRHDDQAT